MSATATLPDPKLAERDVEDSEDDERDNAHPFTQHSTIPSGSALVFSQTDSFRARDVRITSPGDPERVIYECTVSVSVNHSKPTIEISSNGHVIVHVFHHWSSGIKVGVDLTGSGNENTMRWVDMKKGGLTALKKSFTFDWRGKSYMLARMRESSLGVTGMKKLLRHYKVVEQGSGDVVATYLTEAAFGKRTGTLLLKDDMDTELEVFIVAGIVAWREMARRQQRTVGGVVA